MVVVTAIDWVQSSLLYTTAKLQPPACRDRLRATALRTLLYGYAPQEAIVKLTSRGHYTHFFTSCCILSLTLLSWLSFWMYQSWLSVAHAGCLILAGRIPTLPSGAIFGWMGGMWGRVNPVVSGSDWSLFILLHAFSVSNIPSLEHL